jgi:hypothetical protein
VRVVLPPFPFDDQKTYGERSRNAVLVFDTDDGTGSIRAFRPPAIDRQQTQNTVKFITVPR